MAELAARHLVNAGVSKVLLANRSEEPARALASELGGTQVDFDQLAEHLPQADIVICSTAADRYIVTEQMVRDASGETTQPAFFLYRHQRAAKYRSRRWQDSQRLCFRYRRSGVGGFVKHSRTRT